MRLDRIVPMLLAALALAGALTLARGASAGGQDISGEWSVHFSLACSGSLVQTGSDLSGTIDCGEDIQVALSGTFDSASGEFTLTGELAGIPIEVHGSVSSDGSSMNGSMSAPPLVEDGAFLGVRENEPNTEDLSGFWNFNVQDVFSDNCVASVEHEGGDMVADVACEDGPQGELTGTFDQETGRAELSGSFGPFASVRMQANLEEDGDTFSGIWTVDPAGPAGIMDGERLVEAGAETPRPTQAAATPTTAITTLPETGSGGGPGGTPWALALAAGGIGLLALFGARRITAWERN